MSDEDQERRLKQKLENLANVGKPVNIRDKYGDQRFLLGHIVDEVSVESKE